ncbi:hypothetical protein C8R45DRAFT_1027333 [Mycena sanguinolenta]|nr:hypothetical protein C8R45DRAFT_1027333 [Mycena sanguinolenta]
MNGHAHLSDESDSASQMESVLSAGDAVPPNSQQLAVTGRTFIASSPDNHLKIQFGSIDLRNETCLDAAGAVVSYNHPRGTVRRVYSARVGRDYAEELRSDISHYSDLRHADILRVYPTTSSSRIHTAVVHNDSIPFKQFLGSFRDSAILQAYIYAYTSADVNEVYRYLLAKLDFHPLRVYPSEPENEPWAIPGFGRSTRRVCIELGTINVEDYGGQSAHLIFRETFVHSPK